ncbi:adenylate/guanylate cyclase domain-containing protein [Xanthocytophaga flava]|nr:adenylate/guanylate cyclase domain-containing protein [Xanthocytophaga flavus]MDJ1467432.1 adenylate/guanylate cyclase domain-containing protein [Xanthocytophaga flavus]
MAKILYPIVRGVVAIFYFLQIDEMSYTKQLRRFGQDVPENVVKELSGYTWRDWLRVPKNKRFVIRETVFVFLIYAIYSKGWSWQPIISSLFVSLPAGYILANFEAHASEFRMIFRRRRFWTYVIFKTLRLTLILTVIFHVIFSVAYVLKISWLFPYSIFVDNFEDFYTRQFFEFLIVTLVLEMFVNVYLTLDRKLGKNSLMNLVTGKYHQAQRQERVFLFLDIKNSTTIAESMGELKFSEFLQDFYYDISDPIDRQGGEVYQYVGDEVVVSWEVSEGFKNNHCVRAFLDAKTKIENFREYYYDTYGIVPEFKGSLHSGSVIAAEVGKIKSEIAFHGDVLNTASRMLDLCRELQQELLLSERVFSQLQPTELFYTVDLGHYNLRGKNQSVGLYGVKSLKDSFKKENNKIKVEA